MACIQKVQTLKANLVNEKRITKQKTVVSA